MKSVTVHKMDEDNIVYLPPDSFTNFWLYATLAAMIIFTYFVIQGIKEICLETVAPSNCRLHMLRKPVTYYSVEPDTKLSQNPNLAFNRANKTNTDADINTKVNIQHQNLILYSNPSGQSDMSE